MATDNIEKYFVESTDTCLVTIDGHQTQSGDFVAILSKDDGGCSISYNTDALTMGLALKMVACEFVRMYNELSPEDQDLVSRELSSILPAAAELGTKECN